MSDVDNEGVCESAGAGDLRETSIPFSQFCYKPKTALKTCLQGKKKRKSEIMEPKIIKGEKKHSISVQQFINTNIVLVF